MSFFFTFFDFIYVVRLSMYECLFRPGNPPSDGIVGVAGRVEHSSQRARDTKKTSGVHRFTTLRDSILLSELQHLREPVGRYAPGTRLSPESTVACCSTHEPGVVLCAKEKQQGQTPSHHPTPHTSTIDFR